MIWFMSALGLLPLGVGLAITFATALHKALTRGRYPELWVLSVVLIVGGVGTILSAVAL